MWHNLRIVGRIPSHAQLILQKRIHAVHRAPSATAIYPQIGAYVTIGIGLRLGSGALNAQLAAILLVISYEDMFLTFGQLITAFQGQVSTADLLQVTLQLFGSRLLRLRRIVAYDNTILTLGTIKQCMPTTDKKYCRT